MAIKLEDAVAVVQKVYTSEVARHQNRLILFRYILDLSRVFGVINTPAYDHAKPTHHAMVRRWPNRRRQLPNALPRLQQTQRQTMIF